MTWLLLSKYLLFLKKDPRLIWRFIQFQNQLLMKLSLTGKNIGSWIKQCLQAIIKWKLLFSDWGWQWTKNILCSEDLRSRSINSAWQFRILLRLQMLISRVYIEELNLALDFLTLFLSKPNVCFIYLYLSPLHSAPFYRQNLFLFTGGTSTLVLCPTTRWHSLLMSFRSKLHHQYHLVMEDQTKIKVSPMNKDDFCIL